MSVDHIYNLKRQSNKKFLSLSERKGRLICSFTSYICIFLCPSSHVKAKHSSIIFRTFSGGAQENYRNYSILTGQASVGHYCQWKQNNSVNNYYRKLQRKLKREKKEKAMKEGTNTGNCNSSPDPEMKQNLRIFSSSTPNENQNNNKILTTVFF